MSEDDWFGDQYGELDLDKPQPTSRESGPSDVYQPHRGSSTRGGGSEDIRTERDLRVPETGPYKCLFRNLPYKATDEDIGFFLIDNYQLAIDDIQSHREGSFIITLANPEDVENALKIHNVNFMGRPLGVRVYHTEGSSFSMGGRPGGRRDDGPSYVGFSRASMGKGGTSLPEGFARSRDERRERTEYRGERTHRERPRFTYDKPLPVAEKKEPAAAPAPKPVKKATRSSDPFGGARPVDIKKVQEEEKPRRERTERREPRPERRSRYSSAEGCDWGAVRGRKTSSKPKSRTRTEDRAEPANKYAALNK
eukprot:gnl/Dysnectes_brevis/76_a94_7730.p1 GENE.gnl/Dysnectes_brevis/76_a94_7730~~gnl/Dysnectes_brevis/76_a94_7730.p1  ORF type:complete len:309 (-),score=113.89 gnl/Dysnectes_brevis/76_a94_7730:74-1000(-)